MRAVLIGSGASLQEGIDKDLWDKIRNEDTWSCNSIYKIMPYLPKKEVWVDRDFTNHELDNLQKLWESNQVELITKSYNKIKYLTKYITQYDSSREVQDYHGRQAIEKNMIYYGAMGFCGQFAISVAVARGYNEIFLLGYDFGSPSLDNRNTHVFQDKILELNIMASGAGRPEVYLDKTQGGKPFRHIEDWGIYLREANLKIWNVSMISNLNFYEKITYEKMFSLLIDSKKT